MRRIAVWVAFAVCGISPIAAHGQANRDDKAMRSGPTLETLKKLDGGGVLVEGESRHGAKSSGR